MRPPWANCWRIFRPKICGLKTVLNCGGCGTCGDRGEGGVGAPPGGVGPAPAGTFTPYADAIPETYLDMPGVCLPDTQRLRSACTAGFEKSTLPVRSAAASAG